MARRDFDCFLVHTQIGSNRKIRRLKPAERWCHVAGVLAIAAESPTRGALLIAEGVPAEPSDIAAQAGVTTAVANTTLTALRQLRVIQHDEEMGCDVVHDFDEWNPPPKHDPTAAERMRRYRERIRNSRGDSDDDDRNETRNATPGSKEKKEEPPVGPPFVFPDDIPVATRPYATAVHSVLSSVAAEKKGAYVPKLEAVVNVVRRFPCKDFLVLAEDYRHWSLHGRGEGKSVKDVVRAYRNWIEKEPDVARRTSLNGASGQSVDRSDERLAEAAR